MTKYTPTTRSKEAAVELVGKHVQMISQRTEPYVFSYNMRVRKLESDNCVEC